LYSIRLDNADVAEELYAQIVEDGENFHVLAMEYSTDAETKHLGGYVGKLARSDMVGEIEAAVFGAQPGDVIGPIKTEKGYNLFKVVSVHKATFAEVETQIRDHLCRALFARLEAEAIITYPVLES
jgi:parvulin-like peptidyl-prolyl isomerase